MNTKRILFYVTVILMVVLPFILTNAIDNGMTTDVINYISVFIVCLGATIAMLYGRTKKEIKDITGLTIFDEE